MFRKVISEVRLVPVGLGESWAHLEGEVVGNLSGLLSLQPALGDMHISFRPEGKMKTLPTQSRPVSGYRALFERRHAVSPAYTIGCLMGVQPQYTGALDPGSVVQLIESGSAFDPSLLYALLRGSSRAWHLPCAIATPGAPRWVAPSAPAAAIGLRQIPALHWLQRIREMLECQYI